MRERPDDPSPPPVGGAERLRWVDDPLIFTLRPRCSALPRVIAIGGDDALLVHLARTERGEIAVARRLEGAFGRWPPVPGEPEPLVAHDFGSSEPMVVAWPDAPLRIARNGGCLGPWDPLAERFGTAARIVAGASADQGLYVLAPRSGPPTGKPASELAVAWIGAGDHGPATPVGTLPRGTASAAVTDGGDLLVAVASASRKDGGPTTLRWLLGRPGEIAETSRWECPPDLSLDRILPRSDGGWWAVLWGLGLVAGVRATLLRAQRFDARGAPVGSPWTLPYEEALPGERVVARWRDGFAVVIRRDPLVLLLSDGVGTTRVEGAPGGEPSADRAPCIVSSPDGRALLVACACAPSGFQVARADVSSTAEAAIDPWSTEREMRHERARRIAEAAHAPPPPPRPPGRAVEPATEGGELHTKERIVRQARLRTILDAIAAVHHGGAGSTTFRGDDDRGDFAHQDGSGNHAVLCWDAEGLVAAVFDHEANPEAGLPPAEWTPEVHFVGAPRSLDRLVARAIDLAGRMVTGSLWVTAGEAPRWDESGEGHEVLLDGMTLSPEEALFDGPLQQPWLELSSLDEGHGRLALRLAEASSQGPVTLGPEEVAIVLARPRRAPTAPDPRRMKAAAKILHAMGIAWEGPGDTKG